MDWNGTLTQYVKIAPNADANIGALLGALGDGFQAAVEREIGRTFDPVDYFEAYDGNGRSVLYLEHDPIQALASVSVFGSPFTIQASPILDPANPPTYPLPQCVVKRGGQALQLTDGSCFDWGVQNVFVGYTAGLSPKGGTPPQDLVRAVCYWAAMVWKDRDRIGLSSLTTGQQVTAYTRVVPPDVDRLISGWRRAFVP
jgi:hypothetical protein